MAVVGVKVTVAVAESLDDAKVLERGVVTVGVTRISEVVSICGEEKNIDEDAGIEGL